MAYPRVVGMSLSVVLHALLGSYIWYHWDQPVSAAPAQPVPITLAMIQPQVVQPVAEVVVEEPAAPVPALPQEPAKAEPVAVEPEPVIEAPLPPVEKTVKKEPPKVEPIPKNLKPQQPKPKKLKPKPKAPSKKEEAKKKETKKKPKPPVVKKPTPVEKPLPKIVETAEKQLAVKPAPRVSPQIAVEALQQNSVQADHLKVLEQQYRQRVMRAIEQQKFYPKMARLRRQQGEVGIELVIAADGTIVELEVDDTSGFDRLDRAGLTAIRRVKQFAPFPDGIGRKQWRFKVPLVYQISRR
ncbi:MAG: energy transducer TonB [Motiliproteus sp.]|nr:energy transducer TonB [Motiliproteus sp.]MCW9054323.1 energy transducer TonB [Motiliproteus sp.]